MLSRRPVHELARTPPQNWVFPWADVDLDFAHGRYFQKGQGTSISNLITCSRASPRLAQYSNGTWASFGNNVPAITDLGLTAFESRTNSIRNSTMQGAVAGVIGSGGALPTNWSLTGAAGLTVTVGTPTTANGLAALPVTFNGTTTGTFGGIFADTATAVAALTGQTWTESQFFAVTGGSTANISQVSLILVEETSGGAQVQQDVGPNIVGSLGSSVARFSYSPTLSGGATVAALRPFFQMNWNSGVAINITILLVQPQLEGTNVTFAGPPIPTSGSAATAAADVITLANVPTFGGSYTLLGKGYRFGASQIGAILMIDDGSDGSNRSELFSNSNGTTPSMLGQTGGTFYLNQAVATGQILGAPGTLAVAFAPNDQAGVFNGGTPSTNSTGTPIKSPTVTTVQIGGQPSGFYWNGNIQRIALSATLRVPNSTLVSSTK